MTYLLSAAADADLEYSGKVKFFFPANAKPEEVGVGDLCSYRISSEMFQVR